MSILSLSEKSKIRVLELLGDRMSIIGPLRRTCPQWNILATACDFNRVHAVHVVLHTNSDHMREGQPLKWKIIEEIVRKKPTDEDEYLKKVNKDKKLKTISTYTPQPNSTYIEGPKEVEGEYARMMKDFFRRMQVVFEKVKSIETLTISGCNINPEVVKKLSKWKDSICMVKKLHIKKASCSLSTEQFTKFLEMFQLDSLYLEAINMQNPIIGDLHIVGLKEISFNTERHHQDPVMNCPGITNEAITAWKKEMPNNLHLGEARTSLTLDAVWDFIQFLIEKYKDEGKGKIFGLGTIERNPEHMEIVTAAQKKAGLKWKDTSSNHVAPIGQKYELNYKLANKEGQSNSLVFKFTY